MRLSFTKEYLIDYIENVLIGRLYAEIQAEQVLYNIDKWRYEKKLSKYNPDYYLDSMYGYNHNIEQIRWIKSRISNIKGLLKTFKNLNLLNPIVLENDELTLLGL